MIRCKPESGDWCLAMQVFINAATSGKKPFLEYDHWAPSLRMTKDSVIGLSYCPFCGTKIIQKPVIAGKTIVDATGLVVGKDK